MPGGSVCALLACRLTSFVSMCLQSALAGSPLAQDEHQLATRFISIPAICMLLLDTMVT